MNAEKPSVREQLDQMLCDAYPDDEGFGLSQTLDVVAPFVDGLLAELDDTRAQRDEAYAKGFEQVRRRCEAAEAALAQRDATIAVASNTLHEFVTVRGDFYEPHALGAMVERLASTLGVKLRSDWRAALGGEPETADCCKSPDDARPRSEAGFHTIAGPGPAASDTPRCHGFDPAYPGRCPMPRGHVGGCFYDEETDA